MVNDVTFNCFGILQQLFLVGVFINIPTTDSLPGKCQLIPYMDFFMGMLRWRWLRLSRFRICLLLRSGLNFLIIILDVIFVSAQTGMLFFSGIRFVISFLLMLGIISRVAFPVDIFLLLGELIFACLFTSKRRVTVLFWDCSIL